MMIMNSPEVTIEITQFCENDCDICSSNVSPKGQYGDKRKNK